jgi:hypothetical protein
MQEAAAVVVIPVALEVQAAVALAAVQTWAVMMEL